MQARFVDQPFPGGASLDTFFDSISAGDIEDLWIVTAWAKRSGLARVAARLDAFRAAGSKVRIILGVSEGGATKEGLELALAHSDEAFVFHDPTRTFHPKVYLASGPNRRELLVGSSNLTAGGLGWNYESSIWMSASAPPFDSVFVDAAAWVEQLLTLDKACKRLDHHLLAGLLASTDIRIGSEGSARRVPKKTDAPEDSDSSTSGTVQGIFAPPGIKMRPLAPLASSGKASTSTSGASVPATSATSTTSSTNSVAPVSVSFGSLPVLRRWYRQLDNTAAQKVKSANSNPTGNLRLTQADLGIKHETYFFQDLFGNLPWSPTPGKATELEVDIDFKCVVDGQDLGILTLRLSHDPARVSGQANVPTVLHWGGTLSPILRNGNFVGQYITIERHPSDQFSLIIAAGPTGDFIA
jgi:hypothetical protein